MGEEKGGSGIWEGGGVVVLCPAEPMQQEIKGYKLRNKINHIILITSLS